MKTTIRIARLELSALFYSPVAWLALIIFIIQSGIDFTAPLQTWARYQEMSEKLTTVTTQIYSNPIWGLFSMVQANLYLYIPLLTMGLISREIHSGSVKLLLSSPVTISEIVFGKFLAMMAYGLVLMSVLVLCSVGGIFFIHAADIKLMIAGLLGLYLLICAYSAIGLFMSSLTSYQVVAAISTFVIFAALNYIGNIGQTVDIIKDITWFLSISGRSTRMIMGLISTKDLMYFIIVITLFLGLTILKLKNSRESISRSVKASRYTIFTASLLVLGYLTSRPALTHYFDMTSTHMRTLTPGSQQVVKNMRGPLKIHTYVNMLDANFFYGLPGLQNSDEDYFEQYQRFLSDVTIDYTYYYDSSRNDRLFKNNRHLSLRDLAKRSAHSADMDTSLILTPAAMRQKIDLGPEEHRFVRQLEYGGKTTFLRMFDDPKKTPEEAEISAALKRLIITPPKIAFITGNSQRSIDRAGDQDYKMATREPTFRYSLINQGFDLTELSLSDSAIPKDITTIVLPDPKTPLTPDQLARIKAYLDAGGNMLIAGEPGRQDLINPIIDSLGIRLTPDTIKQPSHDFAPEFVRVSVAKQALATIPGLAPLYADHAIVAMNAAAALTWQPNSQGQQHDQQYTVTPILTIGSQTTALALTRPKANGTQKIMILGDADFLSNAEMGRRNAKTANFSYMVELFRWFSDGQFPIDTKRPESPDNKLLITRDGIYILKIVLLGVIPAILLIGASVLLIRRLRR